MVFEPPQHGKSTLCSMNFPSWYLGRNPKHKIIAGSYAQSLANTFGRKVRNLINQDEFKCVFNTRIASDSASIQNFNTTEEGGYVAVGAGGSISGKSANLLILDDPIKNKEEANSQLMRDNLWDWHNTVWDARRTSATKMLHVQTRWHDDDLAGRILNSKDAKEWSVISMPAIGPNNKVLWPEKFTIEDLLARKQTIGRDFEALYQQNPVPLEGALFKRHWWKYYSTPPASFKRIVQFEDCAQKVGVSNDYSVCATWGETDSGYYLLDVWRHKVEAPDLERATKSNYEKWKPNALVIEDKSSGSSLIQSLRQKTRIPVIAYDPKARDKIVRASAATPLVESGCCYLPESAPWLEDFLIEHERFPNTAHDDQVDTTSMMAEYMSARLEPKYNIRSF